MPTVDIANLAPCSSLSDASGVAQAASGGSFSALLRKQGDRLPAAETASPMEQTKAGDTGGEALADNPLANAIAMLSALPHALPPMDIAGNAPQSLTAVRQTPGQSLGTSLPQSGNLLPPQLAGVLSKTQADAFVAAGNPSAATHEQLAALVAGDAGSDQAVVAGSRAPADRSGAAAGIQTPQAPATLTYARIVNASGPLSDASNEAGANVDRPSTVQAGREALLAGATDSRLSSDPNRSGIQSQLFASTGAQEHVPGKPGAALATFQSVHAEQWIGQGTVPPESGVPVRSADIQSMGTITAATGPSVVGLEQAPQAAGGQQNPLPGLLSKTIDSPFGSGAWSNELADQVHSLARDGNLQRAELRLNPAHLGPIEVKLSVRGDETSITFITTEGAVREALQESLPRLRDLLTEQGLNLGQARVLDHSANSDHRQPTQGQSADAGYNGSSQAKDSNSAASAESPIPHADNRSSLIDAYI